MDESHVISDLIPRAYQLDWLRANKKGLEGPVLELTWESVAEPVEDCLAVVPLLRGVRCDVP